MKDVIREQQYAQQAAVGLGCFSTAPSVLLPPGDPYLGNVRQPAAQSYLHAATAQAMLAGS